MRKEVRVFYNDPYIPELHILGSTLNSVELTEEEISLADCVVITTDHSYYNWSKITGLARAVFDTRGVTKKLIGDNIIRLGE